MMEWSLPIEPDTQQVYNHVLSHLKEKHIRITETRKAIIAYMISTHHHPSAEQIYHDLLPTYPGMSLATVYNNLKVLINEGFVTEIKLSNDTTSYFDFLVADHPHIVCEICGKLSDFSLPNLPHLNNQIDEESGYKITRSQMLFYGICKDCQ